MILWFYNSIIPSEIFKNREMLHIIAARTASILLAVPALETQSYNAFGAWVWPNRRGMLLFGCFSWPSELPLSQ